jgi:hypothetical protein
MSHRFIPSRRRFREGCGRLGHPIGMHLRWLTALFVAGVSTGAAQAAHFTSGTARVTLIELYTSEGCSSCPPAEKWLGELRDDPRLWTEFVPVAFHVNYWDQLGWRDRFASKRFTERQYAIAQSWRSRQVYTPCFVRNGVEWRSRDLEQREMRDGGSLLVTYSEDGRVQLSYRPVSPGGDYEGYVAWLGGGITSHVKAGENSGRALTHEFVVLAMQSTGLRAETPEACGAVIVRSTDVMEVTPRRALAVWVTRRGELTPIQATGGWIDWNSSRWFWTEALRGRAGTPLPAAECLPYRGYKPHRDVSRISATGRGR